MAESQDNRLAFPHQNSLPSPILFPESVIRDIVQVFHRESLPVRIADAGRLPKELTWYSAICLFGGGRQSRYQMIQVMTQGRVSAWWLSVGE
jgi:hypothetical protein